MPVRIEFQGGTLKLGGITLEHPALSGTSARWDAREAAVRLPAIDYAPLVLALRAAGETIDDAARAYEEVPLEPVARQRPFPYQTEAVRAWHEARSRGVVVLPTGAGKTFVATLALASRKRSALVVVPTLDLVSQWLGVLGAAFDEPVGVVGGGHHEVRRLTITTYDSAHLHMEHLGNRFGLVIFDECHHLPAPAYALAARMCLAPFRLGLTATPERADGKSYDDLVGPIVFRRDITELAGDYLADYDTVPLEVPLTDEERAAYDEARATYVGFLRRMGIRMQDPSGFGTFLMLASRSEEGRAAHAAYRAQRAIALGAGSKLRMLERLLHQHRADRVIVFTETNAAAYAVSRAFLVPAITHQTKPRERARVLGLFNEGALPFVVTSKVLNEGVNVPEANVAIVLSGSGSIREHVQRLGRVLRKQEGKRAVLYELVSERTGEERTSERRRNHVAYQ